MTIKDPICPECGAPVDGTWEVVPGIALVDRQPDGSFDYVGETKMIWDEQKTAKSPHGLAVVICHHGHTWETEVTP